MIAPERRAGFYTCPFLWGRRLLFASPVKLQYDNVFKEDVREGEMKFIKRQLIWALVTLSFLTGRGPLGDLGKGLGDLFKGFTVRFP